MEYLEEQRLDLPIHGGWLEGRVLSAGVVKELAKIPSKDELLAQIMGKLQSPVQNLSSLLQTTLRDFNGLVEARANQLEEGEAA